MGIPLHELNADGTLTLPLVGDLAAAGVVPWKDLVRDYGADPTFTNDSAPALRSAMSAAIAAGGGTIMVPDGHYKLASHDTNGNIVSLPTANGGYYAIVGPTAAFGNQAGSGALLEVTDAACTNVIQQLGSTFATNLNLRNIHIRVPNNPTMNGLDLGRCNACVLENVIIDIPTIGTAVTGSTFALKTPVVNNNSLTRLTGVTINGFFEGIQANEHTNGDDVQIYGCTNGLLVYDGYHAMHFGRLLIQHCITCVNSQASTGCILRIDQLDMEETASGWNALGSHVYDPTSTIRGTYNFCHVLAGVGTQTSALSVNGATKFVGTNLYPA